MTEFYTLKIPRGMAPRLLVMLREYIYSLGPDIIEDDCWNDLDSVLTMFGMLASVTDRRGKLIYNRKIGGPYSTFSQPPKRCYLCRNEIDAITDSLLTYLWTIWMKRFHAEEITEQGCSRSR